MPCARPGCSGIRHQQLFLSPATNSRLHWDVGFDLATPEHLHRCTCIVFFWRLDCSFLEDKSSPKLFSRRLGQIIFGNIFLLSCSFCLYKPSRNCCWETSHSRTLSPLCITMEMLFSCRRGVFSNRQIYHWVWWPNCSIFCSWQQRTFFQLTSEFPTCL